VRGGINPRGVRYVGTYTSILRPPYIAARRSGGPPIRAMLQLWTATATGLPGNPPRALAAALKDALELAGTPRVAAAAAHGAAWGSVAPRSRVMLSPMHATTFNATASTAGIYGRQYCLARPACRVSVRRPVITMHISRRPRLSLGRAAAGEAVVFFASAADRAAARAAMGRHNKSSSFAGRVPLYGSSLTQRAACEKMTSTRLIALAIARPARAARPPSSGGRWPSRRQAARGRPCGSSSAGTSRR
jgi:hypothetical protein